MSLTEYCQLYSLSVQCDIKLYANKLNYNLNDQINY